MKKSTKSILFGLGVSVAGIYSYNKFIEKTATQNNLLSKEDGDYYEWKDYKIYYTKKGEGSPILFIHDANATSSSVEWNKVMHRLEKNHTVYCIDLLGCGRSDKPALEYTNYLYVQLLTSFAKDIIGESVSVVASNLSASFIIMTNHMDNTLFEKLVLINPVPLKELDIIPDELSKLKMRLMELPFIGTFLYNLKTNPGTIDNSFRTKYYERPQLISTKTEELYYEAAHTNGSNGRYLYSSMIGNYLNNNMNHAVRELKTPTLIIGSKEMKNYALALDDFHKINPNIEIMGITNGSLYPHMEFPEKISSIIEEYLK